jgi:hypothetical protein
MLQVHIVFLLILMVAMAVVVVMMVMMIASFGEKISHLSGAANRHFSIGHPFPSSLPVNVPRHFCLHNRICANNFSSQVLRSMCAFVATLDEAVAPAPFSPPRTKNKNKQQQQQQPAPTTTKGLPLDIAPPITPEVFLLPAMCQLRISTLTRNRTSFLRCPCFAPMITYQARARAGGWGVV